MPSNYLYFDWTVKEIFFIFVIINFQIKRNLRIYLGNCSDNYDHAVYVRHSRYESTLFYTVFRSEVNID